jgi:protein kinase
MRRYEEIELLGDGAFGTVTKCRDRETGEIVAIKEMKRRYGSFDECLQLKEVRSLRKIKHENVVRLTQVFRENDHLYLVFECLHGSLLKSIRDHSGPFGEGEVRFVISQMLEGLAYVHRMWFFHRDIKPENLLWAGDVLKIADFGLAREIRSRPPYTEYISTRWYRAPEIVLRHEFYNCPVDIWAVGAIMAELYTLKPLFQGSSETDQLFKMCSVLGTPNAQNWPDGVRLAARLGIRLPQFSPTSLASIMPNASPQAIELLGDLLRFDPSKRPSASQALQHPFFRGEKTAVQKPVGKAAERDKPRQIAIDALLKDDEVHRVPVRSISSKPVQTERPLQRRVPLTTPKVDDHEFDDLFEGLL